MTQWLREVGDDPAAVASERGVASHVPGDEAQPVEPGQDGQLDTEQFGLEELEARTFRC